MSIRYVLGIVCIVLVWPLNIAVAMQQSDDSATATRALVADEGSPKKVEGVSEDSSVATEESGATSRNVETAKAVGSEEDGDEIEEIEEIEVIEEIDVEGERDSLLPAEFDGTHAIRRDRGINVLTARPIRAKSFLLVIDHRPFSALWAGEDSFFDFLGLDGGGLKIGLGLRYGIIDGLDVGFYRLNDAGIDGFDVYEFDARWGFLNQNAHHVDVSVRAGMTWFAQPDTGDASGFFGQLFADRVFFRTLLVGFGFAVHSESSNDEKSEDDEAYSGAIAAVVEWRALQWLALTGEISAGIFGYGSDVPAFSMAVKFLTHRHSFSLIVSNTQYTTADGIVANSWRTFEDLIFGFQILREFNL